MSGRYLPDLAAGVYEHYKGQHYLVLGYARDANDESRVVVVYVGLEPAGARNAQRMSVRTVDDFFAIVSTDSGPLERFRYVGAGLPGISAAQGGDHRDEHAQAKEHRQALPEVH